MEKELEKCSALEILMSNCMLKDIIIGFVEDNFHSHESCSDQRSDATKDVRKLFNDLLTCEHVLTPMI